MLDEVSDEWFRGAAMVPLVTPDIGPHPVASLEHSQLKRSPRGQDAEDKADELIFDDELLSELALIR